MAHEFDSGLFVGQAAWHGLGTVVQEAPTMQEALKLAGMDWTVEETDLAPADCPGWKRLNRSDNGELLHVCKNTWTPLQNVDAFEWFNPLLSDGDVQLETAVSLYEGKRIAVLARIKDGAAEVVDGDPVEQFLLLFNSHDGTLALGVKFTNIRVVCANTLGLATSDAKGSFSGDVHYSGNGKMARIKHTKNIKANLDEVRNAIDIQRRQFSQVLEEYRAMANTDMNTELFRTYLELTFERQLKATQARRKLPSIDATYLSDYEQLEENFNSGVGIDIPGVAGTVWAGYQAVTEYVTHQQGRTADTRLNSQWFGDGANLIKQAHSSALALVN